MFFAAYASWEDEGRVWDSRRAGLPIKPHGGLPRLSGGVPEMHRLTYHLKIDNFKNLARYCPFAVIKVYKQL